MTLSRPLKLDGKTDSRYGENIIDIFSMSDFPSPSAGVITLPSGKYVIQEALSTSDRFYIGEDSVVTFTAEDGRRNAFTYTGTGTLFTCDLFDRFTLEKTNFLCSGNGASFIDATGQGTSGALVIDEFRLTMTGTGTSIGILDSLQSHILNNMLVVGFVDGLSLCNAGESQISLGLWISAGTGSGSAINLTCKNGETNTIDNVIFNLGASESIFYFSPTVNSPVSITSIRNPGDVDFYKVGTTGSITSFTDVSTSTTAVSVTNDSGDALFTSAAHGLVVGETAVHTTFTETSYNGTDIVTAVPTANTYKVGKSYVSNDSGLFETTTCQVNSTSHGLSNNTDISIFDTINFGGGYTIFNSQTNSLEITLGKAFPGSETTGSWDTSSLNQKSKYISAFNNGAEPESRNIGSYVVGGNTTATTITLQNTFYDMNLDGNISIAGNNELWTLMSSSTGEMRYDGLTTSTFDYEITFGMTSAGGAQRFDFRLLKNGSPLSSPDNVDMPAEVTTTMCNMSAFWAITANPGDTFKVQVANRDGTSNITFDTVKAKMR